MTNRPDFLLQRTGLFAPCAYLAIRRWRERSEFVYFLLPQASKKSVETPT
jgi:hypothetical protein